MSKPILFYATSTECRNTIFCKPQERRAWKHPTIRKPHDSSRNLRVRGFGAPRNPRFALSAVRFAHRSARFDPRSFLSGALAPPAIDPLRGSGDRRLRRICSFCEGRLRGVRFRRFTDARSEFADERRNDCAFGGRVEHGFHRDFWKAQGWNPRQEASQLAAHRNPRSNSLFAESLANVDPEPPGIARHFTLLFSKSNAIVAGTSRLWNEFVLESIGGLRSGELAARIPASPQSRCFGSGIRSATHERLGGCGVSRLWDSYEWVVSET